MQREEFGVHYFRQTSMAAAASMAWSASLFPILYPVLFGMCVEWIIKGKIDFPSHVFFLFLLALFFGWRLDLFQRFYPAIAFFVAVRYFSGSWLRRRVGNRPGFFHWYYASYWEKLLCNVALAVVLREPLIVLYAAGFTVACLSTKRALPEPTRTN